MSVNLKEFRKVSALSPDPYLVKNWKEKGRKIIGWACNYIPEEILFAAGMVPFRVTGGVGMIKMEEADAVLSIYSCSFSRTCLQRLIKKDYAFMDGFVGCATCDGMRRMGDAWSSEYVKSEVPLLYMVSLPHKFDERAKRFFSEELRMLCRIIEKEFGSKITDYDLVEAIGLYNHSRKLMKRLYDMRKFNSPSISGFEVQEVLNAMVAMPREEFNPLLEGLLEELETRRRSDGDKIRLMLNGSILNNPDFIKGIEALGANVVVDSLCNGARYWWGEVDLELCPDPVEALADYYLGRSPCPRAVPSDKRFQFIEGLVKDFRVEGVVSEIIRYCSIHIYDEPRARERLKDIDIPSLALEIEYGTGISGQVKTRVQAFIEMLKERRID